MTYIEELINNFQKITKMKYITFENNKSAGINLEVLLNKSGGCFNIPDYGNVEIKTIEYEKIFKDYTLFTCRADGPYIFPMQEIAKKYGYPDKDFKNVNVIKGDIYANKLSKIGLFYYFKIKVDNNKKRIFISVYNHKKEFIANEAFWDFDSIIEKLERKFKFLAIFYYKQYKKDEKKYYWFNKLNILKLKEKHNFINLIENGIIKITLTCGVAKSGPYIGKFVDHGVEFRINRQNIYELFDKIDV